MKRTLENQWLWRFSLFTTVVTWLLIGLGGVVTSKGVGMAVPDWPTTYGYNMFLFPVDQWTGGIFYEHTHRLLASFVGLLTTILAVWLWLKDPRRWLRWTGVGAFFLVVFQGVLGGLRVEMMKDEIGIIHAALAQLFLCILAAITLFTSRWWVRSTWRVSAIRISPGLNRALLVLCGLVALQLILGATMRHQHAGLAVPDFPLAHGQFYPPTNPDFLEEINHARLDIVDFNPVTAFHIHVHMAHRFVAAFILVLGCVVLVGLKREAFQCRFLKIASIIFGVLIAIQIALGIVTVLKNKPADIATAHVMVGALLLLLGMLLAIVVRQFSIAPEKALMQSPARPAPQTRTTTWQTAS